MSAPCSIGRHRYGLAKVLSTISGNPVGVRQVGVAFDVEDVGARDCRQSRRTAPWCRGDGRRDGVRVGEVDEGDVDAHPPQGHVELGVGAAVQRPGGDDLVAGLGQCRGPRPVGLLDRTRWPGPRGRPPATPSAPRTPRWWDCRCGSRCCRSSAARTDRRPGACRRTRRRWWHRSASPGRRSPGRDAARRESPSCRIRRSDGRSCAHATGRPARRASPVTARARLRSGRRRRPRARPETGWNRTPLASRRTRRRYQPRGFSSLGPQIHGVIGRRGTPVGVWR